jgi:hypothetical protein
MAHRIRQQRNEEEEKGRRAILKINDANRVTNFSSGTGEGFAVGDQWLWDM